MRWLYRTIAVCICFIASIVPQAYAGTLAESLDNTLTWTTGGDAVWADQALITHDGVDASQSGALIDLQTSWVETLVTAPAQVSFWWKVSSEDGFDFLSVAVDGVEQGGAAAPITGEVDWVQVTVNVTGAGSHAVRWQYTKDDSTAAGSDAGWLDQVVVSAAVDADNDGYDTTVDCNDTDNTVHATLFGYADLDSDTYTSGAAQSLCTAGTLPAGYLALQHAEDCNDADAAINPSAAEIINDTIDQDCSGRDATATILDSLDNPALTWSFAGNANWDGQIATSQDTVDAAQSGVIGNAQSSEILTQVSGPGLVTYWWKVSSEQDADYLTVYVDNIAQTGAAAPISGEVPWTQVTLTLPAGAHTIRWVYSKDGTVAAGSDSAWLDVVAIPADVDADNDTFLSSVDCNDADNTIYPGAPETVNDGIDQDCSGRDSQVTLAAGLDLAAGAATWTMGGNVNWDGRADISHDTIASAQSGVITDLQSSELSTDITGPTVVSFWWMVSSEATFDTLQVAIDGVVQATISGEVAWTQNFLDIPAGLHTVTWSYSKDETFSAGSDSGWVDEVTSGAVATVADPPTGVSAVAGNGQAVVNFTPPSSNGGSAITGYTVTSSPAGGVDANAGQTGTIHTITGLTNGQAYTFTVIATNGVGDSLASTASASVTPVLSGATVPGAPTGVSAVAGDAQATVTFVAPAADGGSAITGYTVTSSPAGGVDSNAGASGLSHVVTGLTNGAAYTFTATATNVAGTGAASAASTPVTPMANQVITVTTPAPAQAGYYGQFTVAATAPGGLVTYSSGSPGVCTNVDATFTMIAASGSCVVQYDQVGSATHNPAPQQAATVSAQQAVLTVTADAVSKTYGGANPTLTYTVTGFMNGETAAVITGAPTLATTATAASVVGSYPITAAAGNMSATNYTFTYAGGQLDVTPATLTITADAKSKTYGGANPALTYTASGFMNGDTAAVITGSPTLTTTALAASPAGSYPITAAAGDLMASNYIFAYADGLLTVDPATLTVTAEAKSKTAGTANPPLTYTVTGFVNNDTAAVITGTPALSTTATTGSPAGSYPIQVAANDLSAVNYVFTYVDSTLTVGVAPITTATPGAGTYNGAVNVVLASQSPGVTIYYTTDTAPLTTANGQVYSGPITISATATLQFFAIDQSQYTETVQSLSYTIASSDLTGSVQINNGASFTNQATVNLSLAASDPAGVKQYLLSNDDVTYQTVDIVPATSPFSATVPWTLTAGDGPKTVYVKYVDTPIPNNTYGPFSAVITLDTTAPVTTATPGTGSYNGAINVTLASEPDTTIYYTTSTTPLTTANGQVYTGPITIPATATLQYFAVDQAHNQEAIKSRSYTIVGADLSGSVQINNGGTFTKDATVNLTLNAVDPEGVQAYMLSNDDITYQTVAITPATAAFSATVPWTLSPGDGAKTVYVKYVDTPIPNHVYGPFSAAVTLDTTPPVTTATPATGTYNGAINVVLATEPNATIYYTTAITALTVANGQVYSGPVTIPATATLQFMAVDQAGNQESVQSRVYTIIGNDLTGSAQINNGDAYTNSTAVNLDLAASDPEGIKAYMLSNDGVSYQTVAITPSTTDFSATVPWTLTTGDGVKTVYVKYVDTPTPNNVYGPFTATIILDTAAPVTTASPAEGSYNGAIDVVLSSGANTTIYYSTNVDPLTTSNGQVYTAPVTIPVTATLQFMAVDQAGNQEMVNSRAYTIAGTDLTGGVQINNGAAFTNTGAVDLTLTALDPEGIKAYMLSNDGVTYTTVAISPASTDFTTTVPWTLSAGDGVKTVYVKYVDTPTPNNIYGPFTATITRDSVAPATQASPAEGIYNGAINVGLTSEPNATIYYTTGVDPLTVANGQVYTGAVTIPATATLQFMAVDQAGNQEAVQSHTYTIVGSDLSGSVQINNGAAFTNSTAVTLTLAAIDPEGIKAYMLSNDGVTYTTVAISPSSTDFNATVPWTLPTGDGQKTVYVKYVDTPTPNNVYGPFTATILLDTKAPVTTATPASGIYNGAIDVVLATEAKATIYFTTGAAPLTVANGEVYTGAIAIPATATLQFMAVDQAGNQEAVHSRFYTITGSDLAGSVQINNGAAFTNSGAVSLTLSAIDPEGIKAYMLSKDGVTYQTVAISPASTDFTATVPWTLSAGDGLKTVYVKYVDTPTPNNVYGPFTASITLDTTAPATTASPASGTYNGAINVVLASSADTTIYYSTGTAPLTVANGQVYSAPLTIAANTTLQYLAVDQAGNQEAVQSKTYTIAEADLTGSVQINNGASFTNSGAVSLTLAASDPLGVKAYMLSNDGETYQTFAITPETADFSAIKEWTLAPGSGLKTVYVKYVDSPTPNNVYGPFTAEITVDTTAPTTTASVAAGGYNGAISVVLTSEANATIYYSTSTTPLTAANGQVYSGPIAIAASATLQFLAIDQAGNQEAVKTKAYTIFGDTDLTGGVQINKGASLTNKNTVNLTLTAKDPGGIKSYMLSNDGVTYQTVTVATATTNFSAIVPWTLASGDGLKTVYVKYVDSPTPNNVYGPFTAEITVDTTAPATTATPAEGAYNGAINVVLTTEPGATIYYSTAATPLTPANGQLYSGPVTIPATATLQFLAVDQATNQEAAQSRTYTIAGIDLGGSVQINGGAAFTNDTTVSLTLTALDPEGVKEYMLSNDDVTYETFTIDPGTTDFTTTVDWTLAAGDGLKTVYVKYVDTPTPNNVYGPFTAEITLDTALPVTQATPAAGTYNGAINVVLASEANSTVYYTTDTTPLTVANGQVYSGPITISATATLQFLAIDQAQNQEAVQSLTYTIMGQDLTGSVQINGGAAFTNDSAVQLSLAAMDLEGVKEYMLSNDDVTYETFTIPAGTSDFTATVDWTLASGDGLKTVYVKYVDTPTPNNVYGPFTAEITLDTVAPVTTATPAAGNYNGAITVALASGAQNTIYYTTGVDPLTIALGQVYSGPISIAETSTLQFMAVDQAGNHEVVQSRAYTINSADLTGSVQINGGAAFTQQAAVQLTLAAADPAGVKEYMLSNDGVSYQTFPITTATAEFSSTVDWTLTPGNGLKTVYVKYVDTPTPNNVYGPFVAEITLDNTAPVTTATPAAGSYNGAISVVLTSEAKATVYYTTGSAALTPANGSVYSAPISIPASATLQFMAVDQAGNQEAVQSRAYTIVAADLTGSVEINNGDATTTSATVQLTLTAADPAGVKAYMISNDGVSYQTFNLTTSTTAFNATVPWTLTAGDGLKSVYVKYVDSQTPSNVYGPFVAEITVNTVPPPGTTEIAIASGWNLISSPQTLVISTDLASVPEIISLWKFNNNTWDVYLPNGASAAYAASKGFGVLSSLSPRDGFWWNATSPLALTVNNDASPAPMQFVAGWNLLGLSTMKQATIAEIGNLAASQGFSVISIWKWTGATWAVSLPGTFDGGAAYALSKGYSLCTSVSQTEGFWANVSAL